MAGLSLFLLLVVALVVWLAVRPDTYVAAAPTRTRVIANPAQATRALEQLQRAIDAHDTEAVGSLAAPAARPLLTAIGANAAALRVRAFTARFLDETGGISPAGAWRAEVALGWEFGGFDHAPVREDVSVGFLSSGGRTTITSFGGGAHRSPLWLSGPVSVRRTPDTLVLAAGDSPSARRAAREFSRLAGRAVPAVSQVVTTWHPDLVIEVPDSEAGLDRILGTPVGTYTNIAAVTSTVNGSRTAGAPVHVFVNPQVFATLEPAGAQIVITHESTHVSLDVPFSTLLPTWLVEGFADFVALRSSRLPLAETAGQIIAQVRKGGAPSNLPDQTDFSTGAPYLGATYEAAWLACRLLAQRSGQAALLHLYQAVDAGAPLDADLHRLFGLSLAGLTHRWQALLRDLAAHRSAAQATTSLLGGPGTLAR